jgi:hypothetical protein
MTVDIFGNILPTPSTFQMLLGVKKLLVDARKSGRYTSGINTITDDDYTREMIDYPSTPEEIVERMAQLKNYFGMRGGEKFTLNHLEYAREIVDGIPRFMKDTDVDNMMTEFFPRLVRSHQLVG